jgi:FtsP/CotA-like multicopper oxidase with cupredoxin domain
MLTVPLSVEERDVLANAWYVHWKRLHRPKAGGRGPCQPRSTAPHARPSDSYRIELEAREVEAEIEPGARFSYMTYDGQVPGPMIRVRRGDTVTLTLPTTRHSTTWHSIDLHAVYTPGGEAEPLTVLPGRSKTIKLKRCTPARLFITVPCPAWMNTYAWDVRDDRGRTRRRLAPRP